MRKRLVVAGAAAVLVVGSGFAATAAGAQETPEVPGLPGFTMPDFGWSPFGDADSPSAGDGAGQVQAKPDVRPQAAPAQAAPARDGLMATSREAVTAADVSSSPSAPVQQQVLALVNQNRRRGGCDSLSLDRRLIDAANGHAADMARRRYFAHESPNGDGAGDRVSEAGYRWKRYGENLARGVDSPYDVVDGWMHSPEHRENIMDCRLSQMGVGLAIDGDDTAYWVQDFATPAE